MPKTCRQRGFSEHTYYRWRRTYGGMDVYKARRLKELERENARLKRPVGEQALVIAILKEVSWGNSWARRPDAGPWNGCAARSR